MPRVRQRERARPQSRYRGPCKSDGRDPSQDPVRTNSPEGKEEAKSGQERRHPRGDHAGVENRRMSREIGPEVACGMTDEAIAGKVRLSNEPDAVLEKRDRRAKSERDQVDFISR